MRRGVQIFFLVILFLPRVVTAQDFWENLLGPPPTELLRTVEDLVVIGEGTVVASGRNGLYHSEDRGRNWQRMPDPEPRTCLPVMTAMDSKGTLYCLLRMYDGQIDCSIYFTMSATSGRESTS